MKKVLAVATAFQCPWFLVRATHLGRDGNFNPLNGHFLPASHSK